MNAIPISLACSLALAGLPLATADSDREVAPAQSSLLGDRTKARVRTVRIRAVPQRGEPGACAELDVSDLRVELRGQEAPPGALDLEPDRRPALHALLVDTSGSMRGYMPDVRAAVRDYLGRLRPGLDTALVATFDDSLVLVEGPTNDAQRLDAAVERIALGGATAMLDALQRVTGELAVAVERPVIVLLTDGVDATSLHDRADVVDLMSTRSDLVVFTVGFDLPPITGGGPPGLLSSRKFLQQLAGDTGGKFFAAWTASALPDVYRRIREMVDAEAILTVADPDPDAKPGKLQVSSRREGCNVDVLREARVEIREEIASRGPDRPLHRRMPLPPGQMVRDHYLVRAHHAWQPGCEPAGTDVETAWYVEHLPGELRGCLVDVFVETGKLYDPFRVGSASGSGWLLLRTRPFRMPLDDPSSLPDRPELVLDDLARELLARPEPPETDSRKRPLADHARPHQDLSIVHGEALFDARPHLARAMFEDGAYRDWALGRLREEGERELAAIAERIRARVPGASPADVDAAVRQSEVGREVLARMRAPRDADLQRWLAGWLGDVSAHDLFVAWEREAIRTLIEGRAGEPFVDSWRALRRVFWVPSYTRVLVPLRPVHDPERDRIGFWRVVLPRPSWMLPRVQDREDDLDWNGPPLDLVPDWPLGYWVLARILAARPELGQRLAALDLARDGVELRYESRVKPFRRSPEKAFRSSRVALRLASSTGIAISLTADVELDGADEQPVIVGVEASADGDAALDALVGDVASDLVRRHGTVLSSIAVHPDLSRP